MLDAIGRTIVSVGQKLRDMPEEERPGLVSVTIITDGYENASKEYTWATIRAMIQGQRDQYSWVFSFIGANINVDKASDDLGIDRKMSKKYTASKTGTASVFRAMSKGTSAVRGMACLDGSMSRENAEDTLSSAMDEIE